MMNEIERQEIEAENDGYQNEFQRAAAFSRMQPANDDRAYAQQLVAEGRFVLVELAPRHCKITDAVIGEYVSVLRTGASRKEVLDGVAGREPDPDCRWEIWPVESVVAQPQADDENIPF